MQSDLQPNIYQAMFNDVEADPKLDIIKLLTSYQLPDTEQENNTRLVYPKSRSSLLLLFLGVFAGSSRPLVASRFGDNVCSLGAGVFRRS